MKTLIYTFLLLSAVAFITVKAEARIERKTAEAEKKTIRYYEDKLKETYMAVGKIIQKCDMQK